MNMWDFLNEADDYSNYDGSELGYSAEDLGYFAQGGAESATQNVVEPLDRTLTFRLTNVCVGGVGAAQTAILFDGNVNPISQPIGIDVTVAETGGGPGSHQEVRNETLGNPFAIQGARVFFGTVNQLSNAWTIRKKMITGKVTEYLWQPTNYVSPTNLNPNLIDAIDFGLLVDGRTSIRVPLPAPVNCVPEVMTITFTVKAKTSIGHVLFNNSPKELATAPRTIGNPIADRQILLAQAKAKGLI